MSLYSEEVRNYIFTRDWPEGMQLIVAEAEEPNPHLNLVFIRDNWITYGFGDQKKATDIVKEIMAKLWGDGIPTYVGKIARADELDEE